MENCQFLDFTLKHLKLTFCTFTNLKSLVGLFAKTYQNSILTEIEQRCQRIVFLEQTDDTFKVKISFLEGFPMLCLQFLHNVWFLRVEKRFLASNPLQILTGIIHCPQKVTAENDRNFYI